MHFFFSSRRRHTRWTGDWSSDVCSSDLGDELELDVDAAREEQVRVARRLVSDYPDVGAIVLECTNMRSEERRVGKECRARWWPDDLKRTQRRMIRPLHCHRTGT